MYSDFIKSLPVDSKSYENLLVKGLKLPLCDLNDSLAQAIGNYFVKKENLVVFTSPFQGKLKAIHEVLEFLKKDSKRIAIITNENQFNLISKLIDVPVFTNCNFVENMNYECPVYEHLIFYNTDVIMSENVHISCFYDFIGLYETSKFKNFISEKIAKNFTENFIFTTICKYPIKKNLEFVFGTADNIKHLSVVPKVNTILYHKNELNSPVERHLSTNSLISDIPNFIRCERFVYFDIELTSLLSVIDQVDHVVILYTKNDFNLLPDVVKIAQSKGIEIPSSILSIVNGN